MWHGVQYYRPPFPNNHYWPDDLRKIRQSGLNTIQLWMCWGWIEAERGTYQWDDYDRLMESAEQEGLSVVLSLLPEIQPFWILREFPDAHLVDHMGHRVIPSLRKECNVGLTPGGCFDHAGVQESMKHFIQAAVQRYRNSPPLIAWDIWNELRWAVQSDGYVCYCDSTLHSYREYLKTSYGTLDSLNQAFKRRYSAWEDVAPGKLPGRPYTDLMMFQAFLTWRASQHLSLRAKYVRTVDSIHPVEAHSSEPSVYWVGVEHEQALSRGNDWELANAIDIVGASQFPEFDSPGVGQEDLGVRLQATYSSAQQKEFWVSELQGASGRNGLDVQPTLDAGKQSRWVWQAIGRGAKAILYWAWRDEVFGSEASGFGLSGNDGAAPDRLRCLQDTARVFTEHRQLLDRYQPDMPSVGIWFEPSSYYLEWAEFGRSRTVARDSLVGYGRALENLGIPYTIVESNHLDILDSLRVLIMPWPLVTDDRYAQRLADWVGLGGTLIVESELDAFSPLGFYRYPSSTERPVSNALGLASDGRRPFSTDPAVTVTLNNRSYHLPATGWWQPQSLEHGETLAHSDSGEPIVQSAQRGPGRIWTIGTFIGASYVTKPSEDFPAFLHAILKEAHVSAPVRPVGESPSNRWTIGTGTSDASRMLVVTGSSTADRWVFEILKPEWLADLADAVQIVGAGERFELHGTHLHIAPNREGIAVIAWPQSPKKN